MSNGRAMTRGERTPARAAGAPGSEPGWVDEVGLTGHAGLLARLVRLNMLVSAALDGLVEPCGLTVADYLVLGAIRRSPGGRGAPSRLCRVLGRTSGGMTLTLDRLATAGLVRRAPDPSDRRRITVELTAAGDTLSRQVNDRLHAWESALDLPEPLRAELNGALDTVLDAVTAGGADR
jgi:DNA-binding MarR family transcriptional regulator